jgi:hypothetical protein
MTDTLRVSSPPAELIYCARGADEHRAAFLQLDFWGGRIRVRRTQLGKDKLNRFWTVWLRELIMTKTDIRFGFSVEVYGEYVLVAADTTPEGLLETVRQLAAQIYPIKELPLVRIEKDWSHKRYGPFRWRLVYPRYFPIGHFLGMSLPRGAALERTYDGMRLVCDKTAIPGREVGMLVELRAALACNN